MSYAVLEMVRQALRQGSSELLGLPLPSPTAALASAPMERHTRDVLMSAEAFTDQREPWSLARYCEIPGFNVRCLVDLLAALEEESPFRATYSPLRVGGHRPGVEATNAERSVEATAERFVRKWGFTTAGMVSLRFRLPTQVSESRLAITRRALGPLRDLRWLDREHEWFCLVDRPSRMKAALAKIAAVVGDVASVDPADLEIALGKRRSFLGAPRAVVQNYLTELMRAVTLLKRNGDLQEAWLPTTEERVLVAALRDQGGRADIETLRRNGAPWSIGGATIMRTLRSSPLFLRAGRGIYRLIGAIGPRGWRPVV